MHFSMHNNKKDLHLWDNLPGIPKAQINTTNQEEIMSHKYCTRCKALACYIGLSEADTQYCGSRAP